MAEHGGGALKEFFVSLGLDADSAGFAAAQTMVEGLEKGLELAVEVAKEAVEAFADNIKETIEWGESLERASVMLGQTTDELQLLDFEARASNVSTEELQQSYVHLARSMGEARDGNYEMQLAYARLGTRITDANGKLRDQGAVFEDLAEGIRKLPTQADRLSAAQKVFGRAGAQLLPLLMKGKDGIAELREEAESLGVVLSEDQVEAAAKAGESVKRLGAAWDSIKRELAGPVIRALNPILDKILAWVKANRQLISTRIEEWAKGIADVISGPLRVAFELVRAVIDVVGAALGKLIDFIGWLGDDAKTVALLMAGMWLISLGPAALFAVAVGLAFLAVQDLIYFLEGKDSLIGRIFQNWGREVKKFADIIRNSIPAGFWTALESAGQQIDTTAKVLGVGKAKLDPTTLQGLQSGAEAAFPGAGTLVNRFFESSGGTAPAGGGSRAPVSQTNHITINAPGGNPKEIANAVTDQLDLSTEGLMRVVHESAH